MFKTLIVCPVHNEQRTLAGFMERLFRNTEAHVLFVDDGSTDSSVDIIRKDSEKRENEVYLLRHSERRGYGAALVSGFHIVIQHEYEYAITIDADLQHRPEDIIRFERALQHNDVVLGSRYSGAHAVYGAPRSRYLINRYISGLFQKKLSVCFSDPFCGFRGYRRSFLERIQLSEMSYGVCLEMLLEIIRTGAGYTEVPVDMIYLNEGRQFMDGLENPLFRLDYYKRIIQDKWHVMKEQHAAFNQ
jgi:dolichol-phosphate mannosyltransferase